MDNNLKKLTVPSGWHEVPVSMFQELSDLDKGEDGLTKIVDLISILSDKDPDDIKQINSSDLEPILKAIEWTGKQPTDKFKHEIEIDGNIYYLVKLSSMSVAERIDLDSYASDIKDLHKFFAVLYRGANEGYDVKSNLERAELFEQKLMIEDVFGTLVFFLTIASEYELIIQGYSMNQTKTS